MSLKSIFVFQVNGYVTSRDYVALYELAKKQSVICIVDFERHDKTQPPIRDVAHTIYDASPKHGMETIQVSARGISYIYAFNRDNETNAKEDFLKQCAAVNLEFITPTALQASGPCDGGRQGE